MRWLFAAKVSVDRLALLHNSQGFVHHQLVVVVGYFFVVDGIDDDADPTKTCG
jgi:hypothetical protein